MNENQQTQVMDWNDTIETDEQKYLLLPPGDYVFKVINLERGYYQGSDKVPPCNKAVLTLRIDTELGTAYAKEKLYLCRSQEWKLASFFRSINQKKRGERLVMNWDNIQGACGKAQMTQHTYRDKDNNMHTVNQVERYYDYDPNDHLQEVQVDDLPGENGVT